jgi:hypothetical protein
MWVSLPSSINDEPNENLQTRVSERSQWDAMLSSAYSERFCLIFLDLELILLIRSCSFASITGHSNSTRQVNASLPACDLYDVNRITGLFST